MLVKDLTDFKFLELSMSGPHDMSSWEFGEDQIGDDDLDRPGEEVFIFYGPEFEIVLSKDNTWRILVR
jgi:hypothetical protein